MGHFVIRESAPDFLEKMSAEYLKEYLKYNARFAYRLRAKPNKAGQQYFEVQVVRLSEEDGFKVILGYCYIDDLVAEQERMQTELENALAEATLNSEIIGSISKIYWLIYRIDLSEGTYEEISAAQETHRLTGRKGYLADILNEITSARTAYMGTGLGLPIAKQLAEMMGGTIEVESEQNVGTTFTTTISFEIDTSYNNRDIVCDLSSEGDVTGAKVLLLEDNELNMEIAKFILENAGMEVTTAFDGKEAVDIYASSEKDQFQLILMDVMMPVMDGLEATRKIRAMQRTDAQMIPIFAMTANAFADDIEASRKAGMNEHLSKPLDKTKMMRIIRRYISR